MSQRIFGMLLAPLVVLAACSSSSDDSGPSLEAPNLTDVMPMMGALHLMWENKQADCESVEVERMSGSKAYEMVYSVPGSADNKMDDSATDTTATYKYRLRCKKGAAYSPYSNEKTGTPTK